MNVLKRLASLSDRSQRDLAKIPGHYIVDAMDLLPPCGPDATTQQLTVEVPFSGMFRVTFRPYRQKRQDLEGGWFWIASGAQPVEAR